MIIETLPLMNQADSENKLKCKSIYYRFKNEKKRHIINLNDNDGGNISILELKKRISNSMHLLKDEAQAKIQETDFHFLIYEEGVDQGCEDSKLIVPGQSVVVEKVPWYKIQKIEEKKNKEKLESFIKLLNCNFCKNTDEKYEFLMTSCCGESGCETCMNLKISNNDGNDKIPHLESLNTSDLTCPFCHIKNNTLTLMPNKRMNQIREYFYSLKKTIFAENNTLSDLNGIDSINTQSNLISSSDPHSMVNLIQINLNPHDQLFEKARFFIIKSHNKENIEISQLHNEWATTIANQKKLNDSFGENYTILIFSANKSGFFQGYAIMKSYISDKVSDLWSNENSIKLGGSFKIEWLCSCELPFTKVKHLTNPLNNNDPIIKSRDTQELTKELGIQICHYLYEQEKIESSVRRNKPIFDNNRLRSSIEEIKTNQTDKKEIIEYFNFKQISSQTFLNANLTKNGQCVSPNTYSHSNPVLCGSLTNSRRSSFDDFRNNSTYSGGNPSPKFNQNINAKNLFSLLSQNYLQSPKYMYPTPTAYYPYQTYSSNKMAQYPYHNQMVTQNYLYYATSFGNSNVKNSKTSNKNFVQNKRNRSPKKKYKDSSSDSASNSQSSSSSSSRSS